MPSPPATPTLELTLHGPPRLRLGDAIVRPGSRRAIALCVVPALDAARSREQLASLLWPDFDAGAARRNLRRDRSACARPACGRSSATTALRCWQHPRWCTKRRFPTARRCLIVDGAVRVKGEVGRRRGRKLRAGDRVQAGDRRLLITGHDQ